MANLDHVELVKRGSLAVATWKADRSKSLDLRDAELAHETLEGIDFSNADMRGANLAGAFLLGASFLDAQLDEADFSGAVLAEASFVLCRAVATSFRGAGLLMTRLDALYVEDADFTDAIFGYTLVSAIDLSTARGLEVAKHVAPSSVGVDTLYQSKGNIPESFLRGCGVPDDMIQHVRSVLKATDYSACFISFTEADDEFAEQLYNDLSNKGVRCWRWKEDAKWGKALMSEIDRAIDLYDKLIVVCSESSLKSPAVQREIERALQREDDLVRQGKEGAVLFPIRIDDGVFEWQHPRRADVMAKFIGDFCKWMDPGSYQKSLDRLIRDLKTEA